MRLSPVIITLLLLAGCSMARGPQPTLIWSGQPVPTTGPIANARDAMAVATKMAERPEFDCSASLVPVRNVQAERMTFAQALERQGTEGLGSGNRPDTPVWFVTVVGEWIYTGPHLTDGSGAAVGPWHTYEIVLNAETGERIQDKMR